MCNIRNGLFGLVLIFGLIGCNKKSKRDEQINMTTFRVVNFDNKIAFNDMQALDLDSTYLNLLDPRYSDASEYEPIIKSWTDFHQKVSQFMEEESFKWEVTDSTISIVNRIYFDKNGNIEHYFFRVLTPSITTKKRAEFEKVLQKFSKNTKIDLSRESPFAQCGKTKYLNY